MPSGKLRLPTRLEETLKRSNGLYGGVLSSLNELEPWIADNKLPFFPEYTDHGPDHVNEVFVTAEALIRDEAWPHVTPEDVAVLVLAILLHDCAMHLSEEGFVALLEKKEWAKPVVPAIDSATWRDLWDDFLREAARFDGKKLKKLFGDTEPAKPPPLDALAMRKRDRLLIGEFLRRHHPRLAHEIALQGVPGPATTLLRLQSLDRKLADLGGLVARSHGMPLRAAAELLPGDERRETRNVHAPFLMSVLRIADYLQIHAERAPAKLLQVRSLKSPVSVGEWKKHEAIETIHNRHDDPEALYVKALPKDGATYVGLKRLFASIQDELDDVWAVMGEVYGRVGDLRDFGILIRRLRSNLDDEKAFARTVDYVPGQAEFQAAGADLLKLLVAPLYGDRPEIGIRELLQNSVDACRELEDYVKQHPASPALELTEQEADVVIVIDKDEAGAWWLTVSDRGIGMTSEVVKEYFFKAGASFRNSDAWRRQHTKEDGNSRVFRSGRFGVGVLAAFLLGDRIDVSTRHVSQARGVAFSAEIDDDVIELKHVTRPIGTCLRVRMTEDNAKLVNGIDDNWDWYCLTSPSVVRKGRSFFWPNVTRRHQSRVLPGAQVSLESEWHRVSHPDFDDIQWTYSSWRRSALGTQDDTGTEALVCNGIVVGGSPSEARNLYDYSRDTISFYVPRLSIFDSGGHLPLNLQRTGLRTRPRFHKDLYDDVCADFIAYLLVVTPQAPIVRLVDVVNYPGGPVDWGDVRWLPVMLAPDGWTIFDLWHLRAIRSQTFLVTSHSQNAPRYAQAGSGYVVLFDSTGRNLYSNWIRGMMGRTDTHVGPLTTLREMGRRILIPREGYHRLVKPGTIGKELWTRSTEEWSNDNWVMRKIGDCPGHSPSLHQITDGSPDGEFDSVVEWYLPKDGIPDSVPSRIARVWADIVKHPVIPFDLKERRRVLAHAYEKLAPYIAAHEELLKKGITKRPTTPNEEDPDES